MVVPGPGTTFFMREAPARGSQGFVVAQSSCDFRHHLFRYGKVAIFPHTRPNGSFSAKN